MGHEVRAELASADRVDVIMAFVKWYGLRLFDDRLKALHDRGVPLRMITTTYMGATERPALDRLVRDFGAQVKVQYDAQRTRLHAKAWLFRRTRLRHRLRRHQQPLPRSHARRRRVERAPVSVATPALLQKFAPPSTATGTTRTFETYDPDVDRDRLDDALAEAQAGDHDRVTLRSLALRSGRSISTGDARPLEVERVVHGRHRNLLVAATGTGKTVVAALDYRRLAVDAPTSPTLLFVAHRREILQQSLRTYREVLNDRELR